MDDTNQTSRSSSRCHGVPAGIALSIAVLAGCGHESGQRGLPTTDATVADALPAGTTSIDVPPFRVRGDEAPEVVANRAAALAEAAALLRSDFFQRDPEPLLDVWLVRDPAPPGGYYSIGEHKVLVDLSEGDGAPVHFLVHAFMHANLPDCPVWFDEGLAALMENGVEQDGHIVGRADARLAPLQDDIREGALPTIEVLSTLDRAGFHGERLDVHDRMARYLCYHLQQEDLLRPYFEALADGHDPTGYATLQRMLGEDDMVAFQRRWEQWVLSLQEER